MRSDRKAWIRQATRDKEHELYKDSYVYGASMMGLLEIQESFQ